MKHLLLTKYATPTNPCQVDFDIYNSMADAQDAMNAKRIASANYGPLAGIVGPLLLRAVIVLIDGLDYDVNPDIAKDRLGSH